MTKIPIRSFGLPPGGDGRRNTALRPAPKLTYVIVKSACEMAVAVKLNSKTLTQIRINLFVGDIKLASSFPGRFVGQPLFRILRAVQYFFPITAIGFSYRPAGLCLTW